MSAQVRECSSAQRGGRPGCGVGGAGGEEGGPPKEKAQGGEGRGEGPVGAGVSRRQVDGGLKRVPLRGEPEWGFPDKG